MHFHNFLLKLFTLINYRLQVSSNLSSDQHCCCQNSNEAITVFTHPVLYPHLHMISFLTFFPPLVSPSLCPLPYAVPFFSLSCPNVFAQYLFHCIPFYSVSQPVLTCLLSYHPVS